MNDVGMRLVRLQMENFMSYENACIEFQDMSYPVMVTGITDDGGDSSNGAGKSALFEAFYWSLTGKTVRGARAAHVIRRGQKSCTVRATFCWKGNEITVERRYSTNKKVFTFAVGNDIKEFHDMKEGTEFLFEWLGMKAEILARIVFYGRGFETFSQLKPAGRARLIDEIVGASKWDRARKSAKDEAKKLKDNFESIGYSIDSLTSKIKNLIEELSGIDRDIEAHKAVSIEKVRTLEAKASLLELKIEWCIVNHDLQQCEEKFRNKQAPLQQSREQLEDKKRGLEKEHDTGICQSCGQPLPDDTEDMKKRKIRLQKLIFKINNIDEQQKENKAEYKTSTTEFRQKLHKLANDMKAEQGQLEQIYLNKRHKNAEFAHELAKIAGESEEIKARIASLNKGNDPDLVRLQEKYRNCKEVMMGYESKRESLTNESKELFRGIAMREFWVIGYKNIRHQVFEEILITLQSLIKYYLYALNFEYDDFGVSSHREGVGGKKISEIHMTVRRGSNDLALESLSEGETGRVDIATYLAVGKLLERLGGHNIAMRVLDEPLAGLDADGKHCVFEILSQLSKQGVQILAISHESDFASRFASNLRVEKKDGISTIARD